MINIDSLRIVCVGIFGAFIFMISIKINLRQFYKITRKQFRDRVTSVEDFTVPIKLTNQQIAYFEKNIYNNYTEDSYAQQLQKAIEDQVREILNTYANPSNDLNLYDIALC